MAYTHSEVTLKSPSPYPRPGVMPVKEVIPSSTRPISLGLVIDAEALARVEHLDMLPGDISREWIRRAEARRCAARDWHRRFGADA